MPAPKQPVTERRRTAEARGRWAEFLCAAYLVLKGYAILRRRYKTPVGEIDLIAKRGGVLVFMEVKARKSGREALNAITPRQRQRIERAASLFLREHPRFNTLTCRYDVMVLKKGRIPMHLRQAW